MDLIERIDRWADICPDRIAHRSGGRTMTWRELRRRADAAAREIRALLPGGDTSPIGLQGYKEPEMLVGMLGALKAGHPYVPLDDSLPGRRVESILATARVKLVLPVAKIAGMGEAEPEPHAPLAPDSTVYILFTSGSTGEPKGVPITARCLEHFITWMLAEQDFAEGEIFLNQPPFTFDLSVMDVYSSLVTGGTLFCVNATEVAEQKTLERSGVTVWVSTPSFIRLCAFHERFTAQHLPALRKILLCGEPLTAALAGDLLTRFPEVELWNTYGPTEATVAVTSVLIDREMVSRGEPIPIGRAMPGTRVFISDEAGAEVPAGEQGEIVIAGPNVSPGYLERPDLTAKVFYEAGGERAYRTGDLGRQVGDLLFCDGRMDDQVKIRGFRVELGEIRSALSGHPLVREAAVVARPDAVGERELVAYLVSESPISPRELREHLAERVPAYMVPAHFMMLDALPLTPNGKLDRKRLPAPLAERAAQHHRVTAPVDPLQMRLVEMWERILAVSPIGIDDDFFELGGHSLRAAEFMAGVEKTFGRHVPLAELFKAPTIKQFARVLSSIAPDADWPMIEQIRASGSRPPFFCVPGFLDLTRHLGPNQPCYGVHLTALENMPETGTAVQDLAKKCAAEIRAIQPDGPYYIGGHSFGGIVAFEIAQELRKDDQEVAWLILIDPDPPRPMRTNTLHFILGRYAFQVRRIFQLSRAERWDYARQKFRVLTGRLFGKIRARLDPSQASVEMFDEAARFYHARPYDSPIAMFLASDTHMRSRQAHDPRMEWRDLAAGGLKIQDLPGDHYTLIREPNVARLAAALAAALAAVPEPATMPTEA